MNYPAEEVFEKSLQELGWGKPFLQLERYFFDVALFPKKWLKHELVWPKGFEEFSWKDLSDKEREVLKAQEKAGSFPISVSPFGEEESIEPVNSLGLRHNGEVIGWMITHRLDPDTIRYTSLYIHPRYRSFGYPIQLLADSINRHLKHPTQWGVFEFNPKQTGSNWTQFIKKRLAPLSQRFLPIHRTWKEL